MERDRVGDGLANYNQNGQMFNRSKRWLLGSSLLIRRFGGTGLVGNSIIIIIISDIIIIIIISDIIITFIIIIVSISLIVSLTIILEAAWLLIAIMIFSIYTAEYLERPNNEQSFAKLMVLQLTTVQCSALLYRVVQCSAVQCSALSAVQCSVGQCSVVLYSAVQCTTCSAV